MHHAPRRHHQHGNQTHQAKDQVDEAVNAQRLRSRLRRIQPIASHQNRQRPEARQNVGRQFPFGDTEKQERHRHPAKQIQRAAHIIALAPAALQRPGQQRQPRQTSGEQERDVIPERRLVLGIFLGKALNMLHPEEIAPEVRFAFGDSQAPGQHRQDTDPHRQPAVGQHFTPALLGNHPRQNPDNRHRQRQEAFGHHPHSTGRPQQRVADDFTVSGLRLSGAPETAHRQRHPQGDHRVQHRIGANTVDQQCGQEDHGGQNRHPFVLPDSPCQPRNQQRGDANGEDRAKAHGKVIVAKQPLPDAVNPVSGNRFFKIAQPEKMRHHPVTGRQHLAADLRIARFIRLPEQSEIQRK